MGFWYWVEMVNESVDEGEVEIRGIGKGNEVVWLGGNELYGVVSEEGE